jgi:hypothetical protein
MDQDFLFIVIDLFFITKISQKCAHFPVATGVIKPDILGSTSYFICSFDLEESSKTIGNVYKSVT